MYLVNAERLPVRLKRAQLLHNRDRDIRANASFIPLDAPVVSPHTPLVFTWAVGSFEFKIFENRFRCFKSTVHVSHSRGLLQLTR